MWYDIDINFTKKANGDINNQTGIKAIENSLGNIFKTRVSSRRQLYPFASPTWWILFEPIDVITADRLGHELLDAIETWEDRIIAKNIEIDSRPDDNMYVVTLTYEIVNEGDIRYTYSDILKVI